MLQRLTTLEALIRLIQQTATILLKIILLRIKLANKISLIAIIILILRIIHPITIMVQRNLQTTLAALIKQRMELALQTVPVIVLSLITTQVSHGR
jgi:hypothetical protein